MPISLENTPGMLPQHAKEIFMAAFNSAYDGTCVDEQGGDRDSCASKIAWSAVKRDYVKNSSGKWVKKDSILETFSLSITKASYDKTTGQMRFAAVASDTDLDLSSQAMSIELFNDFISRANSGLEAPLEFRSEFWRGGMPYVSISHYPDFDGAGAAGEVTSLYVDGNKLKGKGIFYDTAIGRAAFESVRTGLKDDSDNKVRISIGFLDWKHSHNSAVFERKSVYDLCPYCIKDKTGVIFLKGQLIHFALTRVPCNQRTDIEAEVTKSMTTRKEDAASIVGEELAENLEEKQKALVGKSEALVIKAEDEEIVVSPETTPEVVSTEVATEVSAVEESVVEKSDEQPVPVTIVESPEAYKPYGGAKTFGEADAWLATQEKVSKFYDTWYTFQVLASNIMESDEVDKSGAISKLMEEAKAKLEMKSMMVLEKIEKMFMEVKEVSPVEKSLEELKVAYLDTVSKNMPATDKLMIIQEAYNAVGETIKASVKDFAEESVEAGEVSMSTRAESGGAEEIKSAISEGLKPISEALQLLLQQQASKKSVDTSPRQDVPQRRGISPTLLANKSIEDSPTPNLRNVIRKSVMGY